MGGREGQHWEGVGKFGFEEDLCECARCCLNPALIMKPAGPSEHSENIVYRHKVNTRQQKP